MRMPLARDVLKAVAIDHGVCVRPFAVRRTDTMTGETTVVDVPCGVTQAAKCSPCAERARKLRMQQCREGWHLDTEPALSADDPDERQRALMAERAELVQLRDELAELRQDTATVDALVAELDEELSRCGVRGTLPDAEVKPKRKRSTKRRDDVAELPRRPVAPSTVGRVYRAPDGTRFRPSLFLTLTLDTYGRVRPDGTPADADSYDYRRAARDAIHFPKLLDRFTQNLRRFVGWDVQHFTAIEPQRRLAMHAHLAIRGTIPRAELRQVVAATYHQVWWPPCDQPAYSADRPPVWNPDAVAYLDPDTGQPLPTWDEAVDVLADDPDAVPVHVCRFGPVMDVKGVAAGSPEAGRHIGYLAKYLTKSIAECTTPDTDAQRQHVERLTAALRYEPCAPTCANWLLYGVQPRNPRPALRPGCCRGKAHRPDNLGYGGRRVLVSRKWSGKNLADHRADRRAFVLSVLGHDIEHQDQAAQDQGEQPGRYAWEPARPTDPDVPPLARRLMHAIAQRAAWREQYRVAQAAGPPDVPATAAAATTAVAA
jgi:hypothetical protein